MHDALSASKSFWGLRPGCPPRAGGDVARRRLAPLAGDVPPPLARARHRRRALRLGREAVAAGAHGPEPGARGRGARRRQRAAGVDALARRRRRGAVLTGAAVVGGGLRARRAVAPAPPRHARPRRDGRAPRVLPRHPGGPAPARGARRGPPRELAARAGLGHARDRARARGARRLLRRDPASRGREIWGGKTMGNRHRHAW